MVLEEIRAVVVTLVTKARYRSKDGTVLKGQWIDPAEDLFFCFFFFLFLDGVQGVAGAFLVQE